MNLQNLEKHLLLALASFILLGDGFSYNDEEMSARWYKCQPVFCGGYTITYTGSKEERK